MCYRESPYSVTENHHTVLCYRTFLCYAPQIQFLKGSSLHLRHIIRLLIRSPCARNLVRPRKPAHCVTVCDNVIMLQGYSVFVTEIRHKVVQNQAFLFLLTSSKDVLQSCPGRENCPQRPLCFFSFVNFLGRENFWRYYSAFALQSIINVFYLIPDFETIFSS